MKNTYMRLIGRGLTHIAGTDGKPLCGVVNKAKTVDPAKWDIFTADTAPDGSAFDHLCTSCVRNQNPKRAAAVLDARTQETRHEATIRGLRWRSQQDSARKGGTSDD